MDCWLGNRLLILFCINFCRAKYHVLHIKKIQSSYLYTASVWNSWPCDIKVTYFNSSGYSHVAKGKKNHLLIFNDFNVIVFQSSNEYQVNLEWIYSALIWTIVWTFAILFTLQGIGGNINVFLKSPVPSAWLLPPAASRSIWSAGRRRSNKKKFCPRKYAEHPPIIAAHNNDNILGIFECSASQQIP